MNYYSPETDHYTTADWLLAVSFIVYVVELFVLTAAR